MEMNGTDRIENNSLTRMTSIWKDALERDCVDATDNYAKLGGDSLGAIMIISRIHEEFGIEVSFHKFLEMQSLQELCNYIEAL